jgi:hypothetical protein
MNNVKHLVRQLTTSNVINECHRRGLAQVAIAKRETKYIDPAPSCLVDYQRRNTDFVYVTNRHQLDF